MYEIYEYKPTYLVLTLVGTPHKVYVTYREADFFKQQGLFLWANNKNNNHSLMLLSI